MDSFLKKPVAAKLAAVIALSISIAALGYSLITYGLPEWTSHRPPQTSAPARRDQAGPLDPRITDHGTHLVYVPAGVSFDKKYWLLFALSPSGDAPSMILKWRKVADRHEWILAASKESRNGLPFDIGLGMLRTELHDVKQKYRVDERRVIFTGLSGGGMASHAFVKFYPHLVSAVIINTGMMERSFMTEHYPEQKLAVFLASPTDFRYKEMHRDLAFLESHKWKTKWIEFPGGHRLAPDEVCEQAAQWLEENLGG